MLNMAKITEYQTGRGKFYRFRVYVGVDDQTGKKKYVKRAGFKTKAEAKKALVKLEYAIDSGDYFKPVQASTVRDVYLIWIEQYKLTVKASSLFNAKRIFDKHILPALGSYNVDKLPLGVCQKAVNDWAKDCPSMVRLIKVYASLLLKYAIKLELASRNPFTDTVIPRTEKEEKKNFLDGNELNKFLEIVSKKGLKQLAVFRLLAYSGMRIGEMLALTWDDVNFADNTISVNKTQTKNEKGKIIISDPKTKTSRRVLDMDIETMQILHRWKVSHASYLLSVGINATQGGQLVFSNKCNDLLSPHTVRGWYNRIAKTNDLPRITLHGFRHTHATLLFSAGASVKEVQTRLGHSNVTTTLDIYTHLTRQDQKETIQKLVRFLG